LATVKTASIKIHRFANRVDSTNLGEFNGGLLSSSNYDLHQRTHKISEFADQQEGTSK
jgi:hypothetical protein